MPSRPAQYRAPRPTPSTAPRPSPSKRGYNRKWATAARAYLASNPLCVRCSTPDNPVAATCVDHVTPHKGDMGLFWRADNWQAMCSRCHSRKTVIEDGGGFGR
jgi:5-methylcytosine-specific restriction protein A